MERATGIRTDLLSAFSERLSFNPSLRTGMFTGNSFPTPVAGFGLARGHGLVPVTPIPTGDLGLWFERRISSF
ncbi:hypothetical protein [Thermococcus litoralis]|uniref:hypothetical protein n=1 Tax=Thermococcus litoralis TaxID=2265 RepID=UPI00117FB237|nr:hypothetical protein [Thermococcus litoralis]